MAKYQFVQPAHRKIKVNGTKRNSDDILDSSVFKDQAEIDSLLAQGLIKQVSGT